MRSASASWTWPTAASACSTTTTKMASSAVSGSTAAAAWRPAIPSATSASGIPPAARPCSDSTAGANRFFPPASAPTARLSAGAPIRRWSCRKGARCSSGTFCFGQLNFGPPPDKRFLRQQLRYNGLRIGKLIANPKTVAVERAGDVLAMFPLPQEDDHVRCYSLLSENRAFVGTDAGGYLFASNSGRQLAEMNDRGGETWDVGPSPDWRYLATANNDQIVRVWRLDSADVLVSLFVAGDQWIAWTPEGYYAASLRGESLMGWHINQGPEQLANFYSAAQFHKSLYRPDVIRRLLVAGDLYKALSEADAQRLAANQKAGRRRRPAPARQHHHAQ